MTVAVHSVPASDLTDAEVATIRAAMVDAIAANGMKPVIDRTFRFDQASDAFAHMESGAHFGKVAIEID